MIRHTILHLHGFASAGGGDKAAALAAVFPDAEVIAPTLPVDAADTQALIGHLVREQWARGRTVSVQGTSLGGFHALLAHATWELPCVAINPCLKPHHTLSDRLGWNDNWKTGVRFELTEAHLASYADRAALLAGFHRCAPLHMLIGSQDTVLDPAAMMAWAQEHFVPHSVHPTDHRFDIYPQVLAAHPDLPGILMPAWDEETAETAAVITGMATPAPKAWIQPWGGEQPPSVRAYNRFDPRPGYCDVATLVTGADGRRWPAFLRFSADAELYVATLSVPGGTVSLRPGRSRLEQMRAWLGHDLTGTFPLTWDSAAVFDPPIPGRIDLASLLAPADLQTVIAEERDAAQRALAQFQATQGDLVEPNDYHERAMEDRLAERVERLDQEPRS